MGLSLVSAPATEPITTAEVKSQCRIDISDDDTYLGRLITAARQYAEGITRRAFVAQTWDYTLAAFPTDAIELPIQPVTSVSSVSYVTPAGATATFTYGTSPDTPKYDVLTDGPRTRIIPKYNLTWPETRDHGNAVTVRFVGGYTTMPEDLKQGLLLLVAHWYEHREDAVLNVGMSIAQIPHGVETLLSGYQMRSF